MSSNNKQCHYRYHSKLRCGLHERLSHRTVTNAAMNLFAVLGTRVCMLWATARIFSPKMLTQSVSKINCDMTNIDNIGLIIYKVR